YRLDESDVRGASLRYVHDSGRGGIVVSLTQKLDGIDVFRDEVKVMMDRGRNLVAISGAIPGHAEMGKTPPAFRLAATEAIGRALDDFAGAPVDRAALVPARTGEAGYDEFTLRGTALPESLEAGEPIRVKRVLFHLAARLR